MAAPKGNKFWELRSKHGRDRLFETPQLMWEAACEYFTWCDKHPFYVVEQIKQPDKGYYDSKRQKYVTPPKTIKLPKMRPYTMQGLCFYLGCNTKYFNHFESSLRGKGKDDGPLEDNFSDTIARIKETIYDQKFSGAASGFFNASIIARDLGLRDSATFDVTTRKVGLDLAEEIYE